MENMLCYILTLGKVKKYEYAIKFLLPLRIFIHMNYNLLIKLIHYNWIRCYYRNIIWNQIFLLESHKLLTFHIYHTSKYSQLDDLRKDTAQKCIVVQYRSEKMFWLKEFFMNDKSNIQKNWLRSILFKSFFFQNNFIPII